VLVQLKRMCDTVKDGDGVMPPFLELVFINSPKWKYRMQIF